MHRTATKLSKQWIYPFFKSDISSIGCEAVPIILPNKPSQVIPLLGYSFGFFEAYPYLHCP